MWPAALSIQVGGSHFPVHCSLEYMTNRRMVIDFDISLRSNSALTREKPIMRCSTRRRRWTTSCTLSTSTSDRFSTYTPFFPSSRIWETQQGRTLESSLMFTEPFPGRQTLQNLNSQDCYQTLYRQICRWWFKQVSDLLIVDLQERALADIPQILMLAMFFILPHSGALL